MGFAGPLFIVGMPRSGTKLLRGLLNRHPLIGVPGVETEFLPWLVHHFARFGDLRARARFDAFYAEMLRHSYFRYRREHGNLVDAGRWHEACTEFSAAGVFEALMRVEVDAPRGGARIWGDKSPSYIDDIPLLKQLYPAAKVLHIVRDVRDYCLSIRKAWGKDMLRAAQRWADGVSKARRDGAALGADYLELRYEDLLARTEQELRRACAFLGVEFEPAMLTLKKELAGPVLLECGYELVMPPRPLRRLSALEMQLAQLRDAVRLAQTNRSGGGFWRTALFHLRYFVTTRG